MSNHFNLLNKYSQQNSSLAYDDVVVVIVLSTLLLLFLLPYKSIVWLCALLVVLLLWGFLMQLFCPCPMLTMIIIDVTQRTGLLPLPLSSLLPCITLFAPLIAICYYFPPLYFVLQTLYFFFCIISVCFASIQLSSLLIFVAFCRICCAALVPSIPIRHLFSNYICSLRYLVCSPSL